MDYLSFYGLKEEPFRLTPDPEFFIASKSHNNALLSLNYSTIHREGFTLVVGEPGTGKTTLLNVFIDQWKDRAEIAMILTPRLTPEEFLLAVLEDFGINCAFAGKNEIIRKFRDFLLEKSASRKGIIIIVDEAQNLPDETLEELRLLSNLETDKEKLLHIILLGQPELLNRLSSHVLRQFDQRIVTRVTLQPLRVDDVTDYINFRLTKAGRGFLRFDPAAIKAICRHSRGIPRLINILTTRSMMSAFLEESEEVKERHVSYAVRSVKLEGRPDHIRRMKWAYGAAAGVVAICSVPLLLWGNARLVALTDTATTMVVGHAKAAVIPLMRAKEEPSPQLQSGVAAPFKVMTGHNLAAASVLQKPEAKTQPDMRRKAKIISPTAIVREKPDVKGKRRYLLYKGEELAVSGQKVRAGGIVWLPVEVKGSISGWIAADTLRFES